MFSTKDLVAIHNALAIATKDRQKAMDLKSSEPFASALALEISTYQELKDQIAEELDKA